MRHCGRKCCVATIGGANPVAQCPIWKYTTKNSGATRVATPMKTWSRYVPNATLEYTADTPETQNQPSSGSALRATMSPLYVGVHKAATNAAIRCSDRFFANNTVGPDERNRRCVLACGGAPAQEHRHGWGSHSSQMLRSSPEYAESGLL